MAAPLMFDLGDPLRDRGDLAALIQRGAVVLQAAIAVPDAVPELGVACLDLGIGSVRTRKNRRRAVDVLVVEERAQPPIEARDESLFL